jgi:hypothetical protein
MKARTALFILSGLALLAIAQTGAAQSTPSYRPPPSSPQYRPPVNPPASSPSTPPSATPPQPAQPAPPAPAAQTNSPTTPSNKPPSQPTTPAAPARANSPAPPSMVTSSLIRSVSIQNSPAVPDTGGHCIICGLLRGSLTAVEPNLVICVTPTGATGGRRTCTDICPPGHDCKKELGDGVQLNGANPSVHVEVLDNDKEGKIQQLAAFDERDARQCTTSQPCKVDDADDQAAGTLVSFEFGSAQGCAMPGSGSAAGSALVTSTSTASGSLPRLTSTSASAVSGSAAKPVEVVSTPTEYVVTPFFQGKNVGPNHVDMKITPTAETDVYTSCFVDVQTAMEVNYASSASALDITSNGIAVHAKTGVSSPRFVQFFYRKAFGANDTPLQVHGVYDGQRD